MAIHFHEGEDRDPGSVWGTPEKLPEYRDTVFNVKTPWQLRDYPSTKKIDTMTGLLVPLRQRTGHGRHE